MAVVAQWGYKFDGCGFDFHLGNECLNYFHLSAAAIYQIRNGVEFRYWTYNL